MDKRKAETPPVGRQRSCGGSRRQAISMKVSHWGGGRVRYGAIWQAVAQLSVLGAHGGSLVVLARTGSEEAVGQFGLALAIASPIFVGASLNLRHVHSGDADHQYAFGDYFSLRVMMSFIAIVGTILVAPLMGYGTAFMGVLAIAALYKTAEGLQDLMYGNFENRGIMAVIASSSIIRGLLSLVCLYVGFRVAGLEGAFFGLFLAALFTLVANDLPNLFSANGRQTNKWRLLGPSEWRNIPAILIRAGPLGLAALLGSLNISVPRLMIESYLDTRQLGIFIVLAYFAASIAGLLDGMSRATIPPLARLGLDNKACHLVALTIKAAAFGALVGLGAATTFALFGDSLLGTIFGPQYASASSTLVALTIANVPLFAGSFVGAAMLALGMFKERALLLTASTATVIVAGLLAIPLYGLFGAVIALGVANIVRFLGECYFMARAVGRLRTA